MRTFTVEELKEYDGKSGRPAYIAYNGNVYDVSESALWNEGSHMGEHEAGMDLTEMLSDAPHAEEVFDGIPIVGNLIL